MGIGRKDLHMVQEYFHFKSCGFFPKGVFGMDVKLYCSRNT